MLSNKIIKQTKEYLKQPILYLVIIFFLFSILAKQSLTDNKKNNLLIPSISKTDIKSYSLSKIPILSFFNNSSFFSKVKNDLLVLDGPSIVITPSTLSYSISPLEGMIFYKVKKGDTLSGIAKKFNLNISTIKWANPSLHSYFIRSGMKLIIPPANGVFHQVKEGETLESIASLYGISSEEIRKYNPNFEKIMRSPYGYLIIPGGKPISKKKKLPNVGNYFSAPAKGWNWGILRNYNGVDISNQCGTEVKAAAEGLVVEAKEGYNMGYGNYLKIEHPNKTFTLYAHLSKILTQKGKYVKKGQVIGKMGKSGYTTIPGCYLHFEVHGAQNPFVKY